MTDSKPVPDSNADGDSHGHATEEESAGTGLRPCGERKRRAPRNKALSFLREIALIVGIAIVLSFLIKTFLFRAFYVPSASMVPTLQEGDRIFVNRLVPSPMELKRGDVVVFQDTKGWLGESPQKDRGPFSWVTDSLAFLGLVPDETQQFLVKRVIGMPGDHVKCCSADNKIEVNGVPLTEPYVNPAEIPTPTPFDVTVPAGKIWVMGDNRNNSADSRAHINGPGQGFVDISDIQGRAVIIVLPFDRFGGLGDYPDVFKDVPKAAAAGAIGTAAAAGVPAGSPSTDLPGQLPVALEPRPAAIRELVG